MRVFSGTSFWVDVGQLAMRASPRPYLVLGAVFNLDAVDVVTRVFGGLAIVRAVLDLDLHVALTPESGHGLSGELDLCGL